METIGFFFLWMRRSIPHHTNWKSIFGALSEDNGACKLWLLKGWLIHHICFGVWLGVVNQTPRKRHSRHFVRHSKVWFLPLFCQGVAKRCLQSQSMSVSSSRIQRNPFRWIKFRRKEKDTTGEKLSPHHEKHAQCCPCQQKKWKHSQQLLGNLPNDCWAIFAIFTEPGTITWLTSFVSPGW